MPNYTIKIELFSTEGIPEIEEAAERALEAVEISLGDDDAIDAYVIEMEAPEIEEPKRLLS